MEKEIIVALAGNPNSGKTTLFNRLTGSNQFVGNWPGVTVEHKTGEYKKDKSIKITDLPGTYSLSPYSLEEVIARNYLLEEHPDVIVDVVDAANIERNLYLATQLSEIGIPLVIALNRMDVVRKNNDTIDSAAIEKKLGCKIVEISALKGENIDALVEAAKEAAASGAKVKEIKAFSDDIENCLVEIENSTKALENNISKRWLAIKLFERDEKVAELLDLNELELNKIDELVSKFEDELDDDGEGIIADERYEFVTGVTSTTVKKGRTGLTTSDKIDRIVTNRFLALPIFAFITYWIYWFVADVVNGGPVAEFWADGLWGETIPEDAAAFMESIGASEWLTSLVADGVVGGVGAVIGFLPVIAALFFFIAILEDCGYMARIAFILDRVFRKFGLSGKSFIPILVGCGCSVSGITGTRTIENEKDRRMTVMCASFMPCSAKIDYITMFAIIFVGTVWAGPAWFFIGILAVIISGVILKKTKWFEGEPEPFVMELPEYRWPSMTNVLRATWDRCKAFMVKAGTIIFASSVVIWFLSNLTPSFEFIDAGSEAGAEASMLGIIGQAVAWIFAPLGFGNWVATVASVLGLVAKEELVSVIEICQGGIDTADIMAMFNGSKVAIISFMVFNQLTIPCFAALGAIKEELGEKWLHISIAWQLLFSYTMALMTYQFGIIMFEGAAFSAGTALALVVLAAYIYFMFRKNPYAKKN